MSAFLMIFSFCTKHRMLHCYTLTAWKCWCALNSTFKDRAPPKTISPHFPCWAIVSDFAGTRCLISGVFFTDCSCLVFTESMAGYHLCAGARCHPSASLAAIAAIQDITTREVKFLLNNQPEISFDVPALLCNCATHSGEKLEKPDKKR